LVTTKILRTLVTHNGIPLGFQIFGADDVACRRQALELAQSYQRLLEKPEELHQTGAAEIQRHLTAVGQDNFVPVASFYDVSFDVIEHNDGCSFGRCGSAATGMDAQTVSRIGGPNQQSNATDR
jgi:hypothetical protein